jgi:hypothetical protein
MQPESAQSRQLRGAADSGICSGVCLKRMQMPEPDHSRSSQNRFSGVRWPAYWNVRSAGQIQKGYLSALSCASLSFRAGAQNVTSVPTSG